MRIFGKEMSAFGNVDLLIFIIMVGSSGLGLLVLVDTDDDFYTTLGGVGIFGICGIGPILFAVLLGSPQEQGSRALTSAGT